MLPLPLRCIRRIGTHKLVGRKKIMAICPSRFLLRCRYVAPMHTFGVLCTNFERRAYERARENLMLIARIECVFCANVFAQIAAAYLHCN